MNFVQEHLVGRVDFRVFYEGEGVRFRGREAFCLFHEDQTPSLSIDIKKGLFRCHAGGCGASGDPVSFLAKKLGVSGGQAIALLRERYGINGNSRTSESIRRQARRAHETKAIEIRSQDGELVAIHRRTDFDDGTKNLSWAQPDGTASLNGKPIAELPLYGSEKIANWHPEAPILIVEGEKAADALNAREFNALGTVTGAAGTPGVQAFGPLRDRDVVLWPDNDEPGREHMRRIGERLAGIAKSVRAISWGEKPKDDAHDFFERGGTDEQLDRMLAEATRQPGVSEGPPPKKSPLRSFTLAQLRARPQKERELFVAPFMGRAESVFVYGPKGHGKTWGAMGAAVVGAAGNGSQFLNFRADGPGVPTLYIDAEMFEHDIRQRIEDVCRTGALNPGDNLLIWTPDAQPDGTPVLNLLTEEGRRMLDDHIEDIRNETGKAIGQIYFDNLATLLHGWVEKDAESWNPILRWTLSLRARQIGNAWVHHSNRAGGYRGSSAIVTTMHAIIKIAHPAEGYTADMGACFDLTYEYTRAKPESGLYDINARLEGDVWTVREALPNHDDLIRILFGQGLSLRAIADQINGTSKSSIERAAKRMGLERKP